MQHDSGAHGAAVLRADTGGTKGTLGFECSNTQLPEVLEQLTAAAGGVRTVSNTSDLGSGHLQRFFRRFQALNGA